MSEKFLRAFGPDFKFPNPSRSALSPFSACFFTWENVDACLNDTCSSGQTGSFFCFCFCCSPGEGDPPPRVHLCRLASRPMDLPFSHLFSRVWPPWRCPYHLLYLIVRLTSLRFYRSRLDYRLRVHLRALSSSWKFPRFCVETSPNFRICCRNFFNVW